jgi:uncharacterized protein with von Willebrand factor type A (vWA) domain
MSTHKTAPSVNAFPRMFGNDAPQDGLTKREYFAAVAVQGLLASTSTGSYQLFAEKAVKMADQLIIELNKTN